MNKKEYRKITTDARRIVGRKYGFRQNSYINFKVSQAYFFCLNFLNNEVKLTVKPMYADDLWWDIWDAAENKKEPLSLRGLGAFSLPGQILSSYEISETAEPDELSNQYEHIFQDADLIISKFLAQNPDADIFYPNESDMEYDPDRLLYLISLIHNGREDEALEIIKEARDNKHMCMFQSGLFSDSYTYIRKWCNQSDLSQKLRHWLRKHFISTNASNNNRRNRISDIRKDKNKRKRKPIVLKLSGWIYFILFAPIIYYIIYWGYDLHQRTLYEIPWWGWIIAELLFLILLFFRTHNKESVFETAHKFVLFITLGLILSIIPIGVSICLFDGLNNWFAKSEPSNAPAMVIDKRFQKFRLRSGYITRYINTVHFIDEDKTIKIDNLKLYNMPMHKEIMITYRHGLFGFDIFDNACYIPEDIDNDQ